MSTFLLDSIVACGGGVGAGAVMLDFCHSVAKEFCGKSKPVVLGNY